MTTLFRCQFTTDISPNCTVTAKNREGRGEGSKLMQRASRAQYRYSVETESELSKRSPYHPVHPGHGTQWCCVGHPVTFWNGFGKKDRFNSLCQYTDTPSKLTATRGALTWCYVACRGSRPVLGSCHSFPCLLLLLLHHTGLGGKVVHLLKRGYWSGTFLQVEIKTEKKHSHRTYHHSPSVVGEAAQSPLDPEELGEERAWWEKASL